MLFWDKNRRFKAKQKWGGGMGEVERAEREEKVRQAKSKEA